ncbi:MAG: Gfo/Idh/MocA family oxidoreductase [Chlorobi bacterium]|nr:Gfo/Idh/MocA family oxidoreductase [Chlorobiota bacterium]MCI0715014.1 Gfo/Idh/MocA family oxidoreductase [Chlorobiota bacterium]
MISVGLAGCGHLGKIHCKLLNEISSGNNSVNFAGVYDIDPVKSNEINSLYSLKSFKTFEELLNNINSLIIVTTTSAHFAVAEEAIKKGINVFIEKPVTSSSTEAKDLIELAKRFKIKTQVGHVERFNPALVSLGKFEIKPMFIESHRLAQFNPRGTDVSVIQDLMIHDIDIILHLVNSKINKIDANGVAVVSDSIDIANARLSFENGCTSNITASRISFKKMRKMRIFQHNAYISIDFLNNKSEIFRLTDSNTSVSGKAFPISETKKVVFEQPETEDFERANPIKSELESFFDSIINDKPVKVSLEDGKVAVEVADEIIKIISKS